MSYSVVPVSSTSTELRVSDAQLVNTPPVYSYLALNSNDTDIPDSVASQLPSYLFASAVPEPATGILTGIVALLTAGFLCVRRRLWCRPFRQR